MIPASAAASLTMPKNTIARDPAIFETLYPRVQKLERPEEDLTDFKGDKVGATKGDCVTKAESLVAVGDDNFDPRCLPTCAKTSAAQYDEIANDYDKIYKDEIGWDPTKIVPLVQKYVTSTSSVLDVGCGTGALAEALRQVGFTGQIDGFDVSAAMVDVSKKKQVFSNVYVHDLYKRIPCNSNKYDAVITTAALMFVEKPGLMKELVKCIRKDGNLVIWSRVDRFDSFGYMRELNGLVTEGYLTELIKYKNAFKEGGPVDKYNHPDLAYYTLVLRVDKEVDDDAFIDGASPQTENGKIMDSYPSRQGSSAWQPRCDPVVWGSENAGPLKQKQLDTFDRDGFVILRSVFSTEEVEAISAAIDDMAANDRENGMLTFEAGTNDLRSLFDLHRLPPSSILRRFANEGRLVEPAKQILGSDVSVFQSRVNFHKAMKAKGFGWHSDFETWHTEDGMPRLRAMSAAVMLNDFFPQNGCLMVIPGSHKHFIASAEPNSEGQHEEKLRVASLERSPDITSMHKLVDQSVDKRGIEYCTGKVGDVVLFDANLMHGSHQNMTPFNRNSLFVVFNSLQNRIVDPKAFGGIAARPESLATRDPKFNAFPVQSMRL